jgi:hypothetical protein
MNLMIEWPGPFPIFAKAGTGSKITDVDGHAYVDFCFGDTGAMFGHFPKAIADAATRQMRRGITMMLPTQDSIWAIGPEEFIRPLKGNRCNLPVTEFGQMNFTAFNRIPLFCGGPFSRAPGVTDPFSTSQRASESRIASMSSSSDPSAGFTVIIPSSFSHLAAKVHRFHCSSLKSFCQVIAHHAGLASKAKNRE